MSKNDAGKMQRQIDYGGDLARNQLENQRTDFTRQNQGLENRFNVSADRSNQDYNQMMQGWGNIFNNAGSGFNEAYGGFQNLANGGGNVSLDPKFMGQLDEAVKGYRGFADNGGFSDQAIQDLRARAIAPTRAVYANAQQNIDRSKSLTGGYSPNYTAATAKLTRDSADSISGANERANAGIAEMQQQGRLQGLSGLASTSFGEQNAATTVDQINSQLKLAGLSGMSSTQAARLTAQLNAMSGMNSTYGTTPGQTSMYGSQLNANNSNLSNNMGQQIALLQTLLGGQANKAQIPSNYQQALGNVSSTMRVAGQAASLGMGGKGGGGQS